MKKSVFIILCLLCQRGFALQVKVVTKSNLKFQAPVVEASQRLKETFTVVKNDPEYQKLITRAVLDVAALLPLKYQHAEVTINLESRGEFTSPQGFTENIPLSIFLSTQLFGKNQIRICDHELRNNPDQVKTLVSHEMGHIIIEWAWRASGVVPPEQLSSWLWTKSIYEGVADYFSATANNTTEISGGSLTWYGRDILKYKTLEEAKKQTLLNTVTQIKLALEREGLMQYKSYSSLINDIEVELKESPQMTDSNAEGSWLAGQLWLLNAKYGKDPVVNAVLKIALTGQKKNDIQSFLKEVESSL